MMGKWYFLVLMVDGLLGDQWVGDQVAAIQVNILHLNRIDLVIIVGRVVKGPGRQIDPIGVDCVLKGARSNLIQALLLLNRVQEVEVVSDVFGLVLANWSVHLGEGLLDEAALGIHPARQEVGTDPPAVAVQFNPRGQGVDRFCRGDTLVVGQVVQLLRKLGIVGQDPNRVVVDVQAALG